MAVSEKTVRDDAGLRTAATSLRVGIGAFRRRAQEVKADGDIPAPQLSALSRLERGGPATTAELARREQITPQAMGATMTGLQERGLVARQPDPIDGRRAILTITSAGAHALHAGRSALVDKISAALAEHFTAAETATLAATGPLLQRLAEHL